MSLSFWYLFVAFTVGVIGEKPNSNTGRLGLPILESVSGFALERLLNKHDFLQHELLEQSKSIAAVQSQQKQSIELLTKMLQEVQNQRKQDLAEASKWKTEILEAIKTSQRASTNLLATLQQEIQQQKNDTTTERAEFSKRYTKSQKDMEDIKQKHDQSIKLLDSIKQGMQVQSDEVAKWQADINTSIASIRNDTVKWKNDVLEVSTSIRDQQGQSFKLLQKEMEQQKNDTATDRNRYSNWYNESLKVIGSFRDKQDLNGKIISNLLQKLQHFVAYSEQERHERGWMVIQHHSSATLNFDRNWTDYRNGFGQAGADVWIGLERIHQITSAQPCELLVELMDFDGTYKFARYSQFEIGSEKEQYRISALGVYKGSAGDALRNHSGMMFSTKDQDNDADDKSCAQQYSGGWWFKECHFAFLNGKYDSERKTGIQWFPFKNSWSGLSSSRMLIRPL